MHLGQCTITPHIRPRFTIYAPKLLSSFKLRGESVRSVQLSKVFEKTVKCLRDRRRVGQIHPDERNCNNGSFRNTEIESESFATPIRSEHRVHASAAQAIDEWVKDHGRSPHGGQPLFTATYPRGSRRAAGDPSSWNGVSREESAASG